ncbi:MAG: hypothetical protein COU65_03705 [Candidatus Pacebacteria bacterium CG10_big_fil_rev_8_21_14_0_10_42_12]|nr:MAG: hypothetical protein COU65_03705 [Candidatus Pacebacteria bacterium CG10_big_fil_rev_8_21_14_0_10_42_12]
MRNKLLSLPATTWVFFLVWTLFFSIFWSYVVVQKTDGSIFAQNVNVWGDWAVHYTMGSAFAYRTLSPANGPLLIGEPLQYPFIADWISGVLIRIGMPFFQAFITPSFIFSLLSVVSLYYFYYVISKSHIIAKLASMVFLFNGGLGFLYFFVDAWKAESFFKFLTQLPREYTRMPELGIQWISVIQSMVIPQRSFTFGFPIALFLLSIFYKSFLTDKKKTTMATMLTLIIGLSFLPLIHAHSFIASGFILIFWSLLHILKQKKLKDAWRSILRLGSIGGVVSVFSSLLLVFFLGAQSKFSYIKWFPGWYANDLGISPLSFWAQNWGLTLIVGMLAFAMGFLAKKKRSKVLIFAPFILLFILPNLFLFQPWIWDNTKLIVWSSVGISLLAAYGIATLWNQSRIKIISKLSAAILLICMTLSGGLDALRILQFSTHSYQEYSAEEMGLADWVKINTPTSSVWITGDPHNHWLYNLTGRQSFLTFRGWLWSHGYNYYSKEEELRNFFHDPGSNNLQEKYGVTNAVIGPNAIRVWDANIADFEKYYEVIYKTENYTLFDLTHRLEQQPAP